MKFRIKVRSSMSEWWEDYERNVGETRHVRGCGKQPTFNGDPEAWGRALVAWFNESRLDPSHPSREFITAEIIER